MDKLLNSGEKSKYMFLYFTTVTNFLVVSNSPVLLMIINVTTSVGFM